MAHQHFRHPVQGQWGQPSYRCLVLYPSLGRVRGHGRLVPSAQGSHSICQRNEAPSPVCAFRWALLSLQSRASLQDGDLGGGRGPRGGGCEAPRTAGDIGASGAAMWGSAPRKLWRVRRRAGAMPHQRCLSRLPEEMGVTLATCVPYTDYKLRAGEEGHIQLSPCLGGRGGSGTEPAD